MADPLRSYESPPAGADAAGLEDFVVESATGERIGTVVAAVEQEGAQWLVLETGTPPLRRNREALRWGDIESVDHDKLIVRLAAETDLQPAGEGVEGAAPAQRATELGDGPIYAQTGDVAGPIDRTGTWFLAFAAFALGILSLLAVVIGLSFRYANHTIAWLALALPVVLFLISAIAGYRLWRNPYEGR